MARVQNTIPFVLAPAPASRPSVPDISDQCKYEHPGQPTAGASGNRFGALSSGGGGGGFGGMFVL